MRRDIVLRESYALVLYDAASNLGAEAQPRSHDNNASKGS
jgi:hypothetical protein